MRLYVFTLLCARLLLQCMRSVTLLQTATAWSHPAKSGTMSGAYDESASLEETTDSFWEVRQQGTVFDRLNLTGIWHCLVMNSHWTCFVWEVRRKIWGLVYQPRVGADSHMNAWADDLSIVIDHWAPSYTDLWGSTDSLLITQKNDKRLHFGAIIYATVKMYNN